MIVAILGPGAVGGFLAAVLHKSGHSVICVASPSHAEIISQNGIKVASKTFGNFTAKPEAVSKLDFVADFVFVTVKAPGLEKAIERIDNRFSENAVIIPLLNGIDHMTVLKARFPKVIAGSIGMEAYLNEQGEVAHVSNDARIYLGSDQNELKTALMNIAKFLRLAGFEVFVLKSEAEVLWKKLVRLAPLALTTAGSGKNLGYIRTNVLWRKQFEAAAEEAIAVASKEGVQVSLRDVMSHIDEIHPEQSSSLARDINQGKPSELEAIAGAILRKCSAYKIQCPIINELYQLIKAKERK